MVTEGNLIRPATSFVPAFPLGGHIGEGGLVYEDDLLLCENVGELDGKLAPLGLQLGPPLQCCRIDILCPQPFHFVDFVEAMEVRDIDAIVVDTLDDVSPLFKAERRPLLQ